MFFLYYTFPGIFLLYFILILSYYRGWKKIKRFVPENDKLSSCISVIVAFRNEEKNIQTLLQCLINQTLDNENFEVLLVNDHSNDRSNQIVQDFCNSCQNFNCFDLPDNLIGKKAAIHYGIKHANYNFIVLTDADCILLPSWLYTILGYFESEKPQLLSGPVSFETNTALFSKLQTLEFLSLIGSGAGSIAIKRPIMCNAANLAFTKKAYLENINSLNTKYVSGDDIFLLLTLKKFDRDAIHFLKSENAIVYTNPQTSLKQFLQQRVRWISKSSGYRDFDILFASIIVYFANTLILLLLILSFFWLKLFVLFFGAFISKCIIDFVFMNPVTRFFKERKLLLLFPLLQPLVIIYTAIIPVLAFITPLNWKGRKY